MECPYCKYKDGWDADILDAVKGKEGKFFELSNSIKMERNDSFSTREVSTLLGCPNCRKVFMS